jgi:cyclic pyranopterin phosphate synthase
MPRLLLATSNPHKIRELRALLALDGWSLLTPADAGADINPEENGETYFENAAIKARAYAEAAAMPALADDSGLEVAALHGRPGVLSARYGGPEAGPHEKIRLLLGELELIAPEDRAARFVCEIVVAAPDGRFWQARGECNGRIADQPSGSAGFGYDPVFIPDGYDVSMAELSEQQKNRISHRGSAARLAATLLDSVREDPAFAARSAAMPDDTRLSHIDEQGRARMVDVTDKAETVRVATACGRVLMRSETLALILAGGIEKGNVLTTAQIAGVMAAKRTSDLIPMCHPLLLGGIDVTLEPNADDAAVDITATVKTTGKTGVEMEALTAVGVAALTVYDMCKAVDRGMRITDVRLLRKSGGKSGDILLE